MGISAVTLMGIHPGDFSKTADTCTGATLMPGGSCGISVKFTPTALGSRSGAILVTSNAPGSSHFAPLSGTGKPGAPLAVTVLTPNGGEKLFTGSLYNIEFSATPGALPLNKFEIQFSQDGGVSFTPYQAAL
jgi:hypothetical protein